MTIRHHFFRLGPIFAILWVGACATATDSSEDDSGDTTDTGGSRSSGTGGRRSSASGGSQSGSGGSSDSGGSTSSGGQPVSGGSDGSGGAMGGAGPETGGADGTGGSTYEGDCADKPAINSSDIQTGDYAVYTCNKVQSECTAEMVGEPALFQCNDSHANNCVTQDPTGGTSWTFVGFCSELGMGGAGMGGADAP